MPSEIPQETLHRLYRGYCLDNFPYDYPEDQAEARESHIEYDTRSYYAEYEDEDGNKVGHTDALARLVEAAFAAGRESTYTTDEWDGKHRGLFGQCAHGTVLESLKRPDGDEPDLEQMAIDHQVETQLDAYWTNIYSLLDDEKSQMWQAFADVVEKLQPGIGPWDKRELVSAIVAEFKAVVEDA